MIRWPAKLIDRKRLDAFLHEVDCAELRRAGQNLILGIAIDEVESEDWDDRSGWLAALAPLRTDVIGGDLRLFYLLWLSAVEADVFKPDEPETHAGNWADDRGAGSLCRFLPHRPRSRRGSQRLSIPAEKGAMRRRKSGPCAGVKVGQHSRGRPAPGMLAQAGF